MSWQRNENLLTILLQGYLHDNPLFTNTSIHSKHLAEFCVRRRHDSNMFYLWKVHFYVSYCCNGNILTNSTENRPARKNNSSIETRDITENVQMVQPSISISARGLYVQIHFLVILMCCVLIHGIRRSMGVCPCLQLVR